MKALVIYDSVTGKIYHIMYGATDVPQGIPWMWVDIPDGAILEDTLDMTDPENPQPSFTYKPESDIGNLQKEMAEVQAKTAELDAIVNSTIDVENCTLDEAIEYQVNQFGQACSEQIQSGVDVETSVGTHHFGYTLEDQMNLKTAFDLAVHYGLDTPYHANGVDCAIWKASDILTIYGNQEYSATYHKTYCNLLNNICRAKTAKEDVFAMSYGDVLPDDKLAILNNITDHASQVFATVQADFESKFGDTEDTENVEYNE